MFDSRMLKISALRTSRHQVLTTLTTSGGESEPSHKSNPLPESAVAFLFSHQTDHRSGVLTRRPSSCLVICVIESRRPEALPLRQSGAGSGFLAEVGYPTGATGGGRWQPADPYISTWRMKFKLPKKIQGLSRSPVALELAQLVRMAACSLTAQFLLCASPPMPQ